MTNLPTTEKEQAILETTLGLIAERGFHDTPMSQIAKRSGVSTGIIYHYFESKDDLIRQLYKRIESQFATALIAGNPHEMPFPQHLMHIWLNAYRFYVSHPNETLFLEQYENSPYAECTKDLPSNEKWEVLHAMIQRDFEEGVIKVMPFEVLYELTLGVAVGLAKRQIAGSLNLDEATLNMIAESCCRAVQPSEQSHSIEMGAGVLKKTSISADFTTTQHHLINSFLMLWSIPGRMRLPLFNPEFFWH